MAKVLSIVYRAIEPLASRRVKCHGDIAEMLLKSWFERLFNKRAFHGKGCLFSL